MSYIISPATQHDCESLSAFLCYNFFYSPAYSNLTPAESQGYANLNTPVKMHAHLSDSNTVCMLVARTADGIIAGHLYAVAKQLPTDDAIQVACCTRLHAGPAWLDTTLEYELLDQFHMIACDHGFLYTTCVPSNPHVAEQLIRHGYVFHSEHTTDSLQSQGITRKTPYMVKSL